MAVLELFLSRVKTGDFLLDGVKAILTMSSPELVQTLWDRQYVDQNDLEQAKATLGLFVGDPFGKGYPLLGQSDQVVCDFLSHAYERAKSLCAVSEMKQFADNVVELLIEQGRYLIARRWRATYASQDPTPAELQSWVKHLIHLGHERAEGVLVEYLGFNNEAVRHQFNEACSEVLRKACR